MTGQIQSSLVSRHWPASVALSPDRAAVALYLGLFGTLTCLSVGSPTEALAGAILSFGLAWASMVDIDRFILPDLLTLGLVVVGLGAALSDGWPAAQARVIGAAAGYGSLALLAAVYRHLRGRSGLGMGDAKLLAVAGAWLGWTVLPAVLLMSSLSCLALVGAQALVRRGKLPSGAIPFGPYIAGSLWLLFLLLPAV